MAKTAVRALEGALFLVWIAVTTIWMILLIPYVVVLAVLWLAEAPHRTGRGLGRGPGPEAPPPAKREIEAPALVQPAEAGLQPQP
jgi:hypothetical protein